MAPPTAAPQQRGLRTPPRPPLAAGAGKAGATPTHTSGRGGGRGRRQPPICQREGAVPGYRGFRARSSSWGYCFLKSAQGESKGESGLALLSCCLLVCCCSPLPCFSARSRPTTEQPEKSELIEMFGNSPGSNPLRCIWLPYCGGYSHTYHNNILLIGR